MRVRDLMSATVMTVGVAQTCYDALTAMCRGKVRHLPVVNEGGRVVGIVTDRDLRHRLFAAGVYERIGRVPIATLLREAPVQQVMSSPVLSLPPDATVAEAAELMRAAGVGSLPVVEEGRLRGIVTEIDVLRHVAGRDEAASPELDIVVSFP